ncbi:MAG: hypothetical protein QNK83_00230 [Akkermansiaceae bacterium]
MSSAISLLGQTTVTFLSDDFESSNAEDRIFDSGNNSAVATIIADPTPRAEGNVMSIDVGGGAGQWGALNTVPQTVDIPGGVEPGVAAYTMSMNVYIPSDTTFNGVDATSDRVGLIVRWNGSTGTDESTFLNFSDFTPDTWVPFVHTGIVPTVAANGFAPTAAYSIVSFNDRDNDAAAGVALYLDDYKFDVEVSDDDPNLNLGTAFSFGTVDQNGGPVTKTLSLDNSGATQTLTITALTLGGTNPELFTVGDLTFPLDIAPGAAVDVLISHDPGEALGGLFAQLEVASNDASTANLVINLDSNSVEPFAGTEFIINGDFETGDLTGWRDNDRFDATTDQARSGTNSSVFNLPGGNQWNEARFENFDNNIPDSIPITSNLYGKEIFYSGWYFSPLTGGMADNDTITVIFRWNALNGNKNGAIGPINVGDVPKGIWHRISGTVTIPETDQDELPTTGVTVLWSFRDTNSDATGGETMYLDDISIKIDVPPVVPTGPPVITNVVHDLDNDIVTLTFRATPNVSYYLDRSTNLTDDALNGGWEEIADGLVSAEIEQTYQDFGAPGTADKFFYRLREEIVVAP